MNKVQAYERLFYPLLEAFQVDAEKAHHVVIWMLSHIEKNPQLLSVFEQIVTARGYPYTNERLQTVVGGVDLPNPIILPAGYDKNAEAVRALFALAFGGVENGTVPTKGQPGNPPKRVFRPRRNVILNCYGFNSDGSKIVSGNLKNYEERRGALGLSIGINKDRPHEQAPTAHREVLAQTLEQVDFFTINVSSPNTKDLRALQTYESLKAIVLECFAEMKERGIMKPVFIKLAPDLPYEMVDEIVRLVEELHLAGLMLTNTTNNPDIKASLGQQWSNQAGGVSGTPVRALATQMIAHVHHIAPTIPIIGMGGIKDLESALEKFFAGASAVGILTALVFQGPSLPSQLLLQLDQWMEENGVSNIREIVGVRR
jgi:dihydroorotate dehydrogenase